MPYFYNFINFKIKTVGSSKYIIRKCKNTHWSEGLLLYSNNWKSEGIRNTLMLTKISSNPIIPEYKAINNPSIQNEKWGYVPYCHFLVKPKIKSKYLISNVFWRWWQFGMKQHLTSQQIINYKSNISKLNFIQIFCWIRDWTPDMKIHKMSKTLFTLRIFFPSTWIKLQKKFFIKMFNILKLKKNIYT